MRSGAITRWRYAAVIGVYVFFAAVFLVGFVVESDIGFWIPVGGLAASILGVLVCVVAELRSADTPRKTLLVLTALFAVGAPAAFFTIGLYGAAAIPIWNFFAWLACLIGLAATGFQPSERAQP